MTEDDRRVFDFVHVSKRYGDARALHEIDLQILPGRTTVLIGPSGCGKSTLLRLMVGLIVPDAGSVAFEGTPLTASNVGQLRQRMGYVIQEGGLFPHLSARANVTLMARHLGWPTNRQDERVSALVELTQFPRDGLDRFPAQLSGGQRQRVSLMRALMLDPAVLLLDEPLGALDPMIRSELQTDLRDIFARLQKTVVMVTHDLAEASYFGREIVLLREGSIVQQGTLQGFCDQPVEPFVTQFVQAQRTLATPGDGGARCD